MPFVLYINNNAWIHLGLGMSLSILLAYYMLGNRIVMDFIYPVGGLFAICLFFLIMASIFIHPNQRYTLIRGIIFYIIVSSIIISGTNYSTFDKLTIEKWGYLKQLLYYLL